MTQNEPAKRWRVDARAKLPPPVPESIRLHADAVTFAGAPPVARDPGQVVRRSAKNKPAKKTSNTKPLAFDICEHESQKQGESKSWASSIGLHLIAFFVIALLLAPADFGGGEMHEITMRLGDGDGQGDHQGVDVDIDVAEPETVVEHGEAAAAPPTNGKSGVGAKGNKQEGPRGSFFGIDASGHEFVYVLDMSGSMKGQRFDEATAELIKSVDGLTEAQRFYVILFSDTALQMFDETSSHPSAITASAANKGRLRSWLANGAFKGGSTDPRDALRIGLAMNPSAIFMLSDGEFREKKRKSNSVFEGQSDTYQIVSGALYKPPIHAIAFQDATSCHNMKRLSHISGGQYRFVGNQDNKVAERMMRAARDTLYDGDKRAGVKLLQQIVAQHGVTEFGWKAREKLVQLRAEQIDAKLKTNRTVLAHQDFISLVKVDPKGTVTGDLQTKILKELIAHASITNDADEIQSLMQLFSSITKQYGRKDVIDPIIQPFMRQRFDAAIVMSKEGKDIEAVATLAHITRNFPYVSFARDCHAMEAKLSEKILAEGEDYRRSNGNVKYAQRMRELNKATSSANIRTRVLARLGELGKDLRKARDAAKRRGDAEQLATLDEAIDDAFDSEATMEKVIGTNQSVDLVASRLLRTAMQVERKSGMNAAKSAYQRVLKSFPESPAGRIAKERLRNAAAAPEPVIQTLESMLSQ